MRLVIVDDHTHSAKNQPVNLGAFGKRVRIRRTELDWTQEELALKADVGLGTVQALEDAANRKAPRQTSPQNLEKIAKALGRTLDDLITGREIIAASDPRRDKLTAEDLEIARLYHDAMTATRQRAEVILRGAGDDRASAIWLRLQRLPPEFFATFEALLASTEERLARRKSDEKKHGEKKRNP